MTVLFVLLGAFLGAAIGAAPGLAAGIAIGFLAARLRALGRTQRALHSRLDELAGQLSRIDRAPPAAGSIPQRAIQYARPAQSDSGGRIADTLATDALAPPARVERDPNGDIHATSVNPGVNPGHPSDGRPNDDTRTTPGGHPAPAGSAEAAPAWPRSVWDDHTSGAAGAVAGKVEAALSAGWSRLVGFFTTGNVIARVGVLVLFCGVAFLVRLAAERGLVPIELRLAAIAAGAMALLVVGWRLRGRRRDWALVVQGGGVGVLYLTVFAAARLYGLVPLPMAFALLVGLVAASGALAVLQNAPVLAVLGITGGFLAPVLTSSSAGSHVALFSYYALLNAGILAIAWFRAWRALNLLGFAFTWVIGALWGARYYHADYFASVEPFVVLSFLFYLVLPVLYAQRQKPELRGLVDGTLVFGNPLLFFTIQNRLIDDIDFGRAFSALAVGFVYAALARALWRRDPAGMRLLAESFLALAILFATLAVPFAVDGHWTAAAWALEGAGLVWVGLRQRRYLAQVAGLGLELAAAVTFVLQLPLRFGPAPPSDASALGAALIGLAGGFTAFRLVRDAERAWAVLRPLALALLIWSALWWCAALSIAVDSRASPAAFVAVFAGALVLSGLALAALARRLDWHQAALLAAAVVPLGAGFAGVHFLAEIQAGPWRDGGWFAWPLLVVGGYVLTARFAAAWPARLLDGIHLVLLALVVFFLTWLAAHGVAAVALLDGSWVLATCGAVSVAACAALMGSTRHPRWPLNGSAMAYARVGPALLVSALGVWLVVSAGDDGTANPIRYLPLLNPLDLTAGAALLTMFAWGQRGDCGSSSRASGRWVLVVLCAAAFLVINTGILRAMHHYADVPYTAHALWRAPTVQAALALTWALLGGLAMAVAARLTQDRAHWLAGAALLGLVVIKLFAIDLAGSGAVARIVSFIGVGLVCLVIGYFAPIPPRSSLAAGTS